MLYYGRIILRQSKKVNLSIAERDGENFESNSSQSQGYATECKTDGSFIILSVITSLIVGYVSYISAYNAELDLVKQNLISLAQSATLLIDGDRHQQIEPGEEDTAVYQSQRQILQHFQQRTSVTYVYTLAADENGNLYFVVDADPEEPAAIGEEYMSTPSMVSALQGEAAADEEPSSDRWGTFLSGFAPIYDSQNAQDIAHLITGIQQQVEQANSAIAKLQHNFQAQTEAVQKTGDAFAMIADSVNAIVKHIEQVNSSILKLEAGNMTINNSFGSLAATSEATTAPTTNISQAAEEQSVSTQQIVTSITQLHDLAAELYESVKLFKT
ncbi:MAG: hypothetical protein GXY92_00175 [Syntrophomonadaceae bacterium]|nr:hypothetical protein [Syntrophomonadaceae bacterium]